MLSKRCIHCKHKNSPGHFELGWDAICSQCGKLTWIKPGQLRVVRVTKLSDFGIHVDVGGGTEGLIHITELSVSRIEHPSDILDVDEVVTAVVLRVDLDTKKIGLSIRRVPRDTENKGE